jgi:Tfp pilus assembly protein PilF
MFFDLFKGGSMVVRMGKLAVLMSLFVVVQLHAQSIEALMSRGQHLLERGAFNEAVTVFRSVLSKEPDNFEAQFNLGFAYLQWGRNSNAVDEFKKALRYQPGHSEVWSNLAIAYENMGKSDLSIGALNNAVKYNPGNITARINLAAMYHNANQFARAIAHYKEAVAIDGTHEEALTNLAKCLVSTGKFSEAKHYLMQAIAANPKNGEARWELGNIALRNEKDTAKAISEYKLAISANPSQPAFYESLAAAYEAKADKKEAIATLKSSLVYIDDILQRDKMQERIDRLELGDTKKQDGGSSKMATKSNVDELRKELRGQDHQQTQVRTTGTKPVDVMGDFKGLSDVDDSDPLDLLGESKKKSADKKK